MTNTKKHKKISAQCTRTFSIKVLFLDKLVFHSVKFFCLLPEVGRVVKNCTQVKVLLEIFTQVKLIV